MNQLKQIDDPGETADFISSQLLLAPKKRQETPRDIRRHRTTEDRQRVRGS